MDPQFSTSSGLSTPVDSACVVRNAGCPLSSSVIVIFSAISSLSHCRLSSLIEDTFLSDPGPMNNHCLAPNLFAKRKTN